MVTEAVLRPARMTDVPAIQRLVARSIRALLGPFITPEQVALSLEHVFGVDTDLITDGTYHVLEDGGRIVGAGGWGARATLYGHGTGAPAPLLDPARDPARIRHVYVDPDWARRGLGSRLLRHAEEQARVAGFRIAELVATPAGEPLFARGGYTVVAREPVALPGAPPIVCARMRKELLPGGDT